MIHQTELAGTHPIKAASFSRWKSLFWNLMKILLLASFVGSLFSFFAIWFTYQLFSDKVDQVLSWDLAQRYEQILAPLASPAFSCVKVQEKIHELCELNPRVDILLLNSKGEVVCSIYPKSYNATASGTCNTIPIERVKQFLKTAGYPLSPIIGPVYKDRPSILWWDGRAAFSAAPITIGDKPGYVYVSLRGKTYQQIYQALGDFAIFAAFGALWIVLTLVFTLLGYSLSYFYTQRFRNLTQAIERFSSGDLSTRVKQVSNDELGLHAQAFNTMAATIESNIETMRQMDEERRQMIASISHDIRNPLAALRSLLESLHSGFLEMQPSEQKDFLDRTLANCSDLETLVNDLFELSKLNAQTKAPKMQTLGLLSLVRGVIRKLGIKAGAKDLAVHTDIPQNLPQVLGDEQMLNRVLSNLMENAIRYSTSGGDIRISAVEKSKGTVLVSVADTGVGIPEEEIEHIFERFYRGKRGAKMEHSGSGLGLAIVKRILELHQQEIHAESKLGEGSSFYFTLSAETQPE